MKLRILGALFLAASMAGLSGCIVAGPDYESAAYEGGYAYTYYPDVGVYYYEPSHVYYWNEGGSWRYGSALPPAYPRVTGGVSITLDSDRPYTRHDYVVRRYGGPGHMRRRDGE